MKERVEFNHPISGTGDIRRIKTPMRLLQLEVAGTVEDNMGSKSGGRSMSIEMNRIESCDGWLAFMCGSSAR